MVIFPWLTNRGVLARALPPVVFFFCERRTAGYHMGGSNLNQIGKDIQEFFL